VRPIKVWAPAADTLVFGLARALEQDEHQFRDTVVDWLRDNLDAEITMVMGTKSFEVSLKDVWQSEYGEAGLEMNYLQRDGKTVAKTVTEYGQWAYLMRKVGTYTDLCFRCAVAAMFRVTLACGDLEEGADCEELNLLVPVGAKRKLHLFWSLNDQGWYWGDESKECASEEDMRYVKNLGYDRVVLQGESLTESVHVHDVEHKSNDEGFFAALAGALNHEAGLGPPGALKHTLKSVCAAVRSHCELNMEPISKAFNRIYIEGKRCMWMVGIQQEVGYVPMNAHEWLDWSCSGVYEVDALLITAAAACFQAQVIVVKRDCKCARAVVCCRSNHPAGPNQVVVPKCSVRRLFLFWMPALGYDWGHAHHCLEHVCPDQKPGDIFFIAPEIDGSAREQPDGQGKSSQRNPIPNLVASDDDEAIVASGSSEVGTSGKGTKRRKEQGTGRSMCGEIRKCDMSV
jgi:hypothetical protein